MSAESKRVVVAMSGGVDSSVAAALLQQQGYQVIGMMLRLWNEPGGESYNRCCTPDSMAQARRVAAILGIPFYAVDGQEAFYQQVVIPFLDGYTQNTTPNPCAFCNRHVRWEFLLQRALTFGASYMATGHYVRLQRDADGRAHLHQALDPQKDQSYILHVLGQDQLKYALFPLGEYSKPEIRQLARDFKLPVSERSDSQDLCFLGQSDLRGFLQRHAPASMVPGPITDRQGRVLGQHQGLASYTIGQRKGLGIAAPRPLYVLARRPVDNTLVVGEKSELGCSSLITHPVHWISGAAPATPFQASLKIRSTAPLTPAWIQPLPDGGMLADFAQPLRDITPGQAAVIYLDGEVLGGGIIKAAGSGQNSGEDNA
ncbi:MAG TPA: tRNA 2-thiouridine(34) synthase MnmA [Anaerolineales bacterium]|nr:tRNA 2-thiouridine(34) synthase MnmA [Anaerolineales bacterium]